MVLLQRYEPMSVEWGLRLTQWEDNNRSFKVSPRGLTMPEIDVDER
jgi:hypothetical protein